MSSPQKSTRIPYRSAAVLPQGLPPLNLFRLWAHSPSTLPHIISLGTACFRDTSLSPATRELICLLTASRLSCDYLWKQHVQIARGIGICEAQIEAIGAGQLDGVMWSAEEKALLAFVDAVISVSEVEDGVFNGARDFFGDQGLVEIVTLQGFYYSLSRIVTVFHVGLESTSIEDAQRAISKP